MSAVPPILPGMLVEHDLGAEQKAHSQLSCRHDPKVTFTGLEPLRFEVARLVREILLRMRAHRAVLRAPHESFIHPLAVELPRPRCRNDWGAELLEAGDAFLVCGDSLVPRRLIERRRGSNPPTERHLIQNQKIRRFVSDTVAQRLPHIAPRAELRGHLANANLHFVPSSGSYKLQDTTIAVMDQPTWQSLLPPIIAIATALITKQVFLSLFAGIWLGWILLDGGNPILGLRDALESMVAVFLDRGNALILIFSAQIGAFIALTQRSGGVEGFVNWIVDRGYVRTAKPKAR